VRMLREAARLAVRRGSPDTAIAYLQRALDEPAEGQDLTEILVQLIVEFGLKIIVKIIVEVVFVELIVEFG